MTRVTMQRARDDDRVKVLHIEQASMIRQRFDSGREVTRLLLAARVDIGRGNEFDVRNVEKRAHEFLAACARPDDSQPHAIVCSQHASAPICESDRRRRSCLFYELSSLDWSLLHDRAPLVSRAGALESNPQAYAHRPR